MLDKIKRYDHENDYMLLNRMFLERDMKCPLKEDLPKVGFILEDLGAMFLISTEINIGIIEYLIVNKKLKRKKRDELIIGLAVKTIEHARKTGMKKIIFTTRFGSLVSKAMGLGFNNLGEFCSLSKELSNG